MDHASYFIKDRALFGSFPTQESVDTLEQEGVRFFVDLTQQDEKYTIPYKTKHTYINYPIPDHHTPTNWKSFAKFIIKISRIIKKLESNELLYLHCKGGHDRSSMVAACIICYIFALHPSVAIDKISHYHSKRSVLREKWRYIDVPSQSQRDFIQKFFEPLYFYRAYTHGHTAGFSNFTAHPVKLEGIGTFPTSEAAFQALKNPYDKDYVNKQLEAKSPLVSKSLGRKIDLIPNWKSKCDDLMYYVLTCKFQQHFEFREALMNTGLRPIIQNTITDLYWGNGGEEGKGFNKMGKLLTKLRHHCYKHEN